MGENLVIPTFLSVKQCQIGTRVERICLKDGGGRRGVGCVGRAKPARGRRSSFPGGGCWGGGCFDVAADGLA